MESKIVVIGIGEMGSVFARGFLKLGYPVYPVTSAMDMQEVARAISQPKLVVVAVGEANIHQVIKALPDHWRDRVVLLQNELLPRDWQGQLTDPTVISVWFEKKKGQDSKVVLPSPVFGPHAALVKAALGSLDIPATVLANSEQLLYELVRKNVYILTTNIAGLEVGGTVDDLWHVHQQLARDVAQDVLVIQQHLTGQLFNTAQYLQGMLEAFHGDPQHKCMGRSAPQRLTRALQQAQSYGLQVPTLERLRSKITA